jgi:hypothetical protein
LTDVGDTLTHINRSSACSLEVDAKISPAKRKLRAAESEIRWRSLTPIVLARVCHGGWTAGNVTRRRTASDTGLDCRRESGRYGGLTVFFSGMACRWNHGTISNWLKSHFLHYKDQYRRQEHDN